MAIGLVGKPSGTRIITGSINYGERRREERNAMTRVVMPGEANRYARKIIVAGMRGTYKMNKRTRRSR